MNYGQVMEAYDLLKKKRVKTAITDMFSIDGKDLVNEMLIKKAQYPKWYEFYYHLDAFNQELFNIYFEKLIK